MIAYTDGDIFDSPAQTLVNPVNTVGVMGAGLAAQFKRRYPAMYKHYVVNCQAGQLQIGELWLWRAPVTPSRWVLNFPTKVDWRAPSKLEWIEAGLRCFVDTYSDMGITSVAFPFLGCGHGGLDWLSEVQPLMARHLDQLPIPVYVHGNR